MSRSPFLSVVIPLYNKGAYIERAIRSVLAQSYGDYEIVVIDDGSTDGGGEIVLRMGEPRIRLVRQENAGEGAARNRGIRESRGTLVAMLDGDDEWLPGFLGAVASLSDRFPEAGIFATGYRTVLPRRLMIDTTLQPPQGGEQILVRDYFRKARVACFVWSSAQAIPRRVYEDVGVFAENEPMGSDLDMWGRIALKYPVAYDCRPLALYRNDAAGRVVTLWARKPTFPPFVRSARAAIARREVAEEMLPDLDRYLERLLLRYVERVVASGDRNELRRVLAEEFSGPAIRERDVTFLKTVGMRCPMALLYLYNRIRNSRYVSLRGCFWTEDGVVHRVHRNMPARIATGRGTP